MSRRTPGEPFARVLGASPSPLGRLAAGRKGSREGALGPGKMRGLALGAVWGPRSGRTQARAGRGAAGVERPLWGAAAGARRCPASERLQTRPLSRCRIARYGL